MRSRQRTYLSAMWPKINSGLLIACGVLLLVIQFEALQRNQKLTKTNFEKLLHLGMAKVNTGLVDNYYCYSVQTQEVIPADRSFFLMSPNYEDPQPLDTVLTGAMNDDFQFKTFNFATPTQVQLRMDFEFLPLRGDKPLDSLNNSERYTYEFYSHSIMSSKGERLVDTVILESLIDKHIRSIPGTGELGYALFLNDSLMHSHQVKHIEGGRSFPVYGAGPFPPVEVVFFMGKGKGWYRTDQFRFLLAALVLTTLIVILMVMNQRSLTELRRVNALKTDFVHLITHEFNTPITNLTLAVEKFKPGLSAERLDRIMRIVGIEVQRIKTDIETLVQINQLSSEHLELKTEACRVHELIRTTLDLFEETFESRGIRLKLDLQAIHDGIMGDRIHLLNVFTNVLENSVKYGGDSPEIKISSRNAGHQIQIVIEDNGIGMEPGQSRHAFDKFYRSDKLEVQTVQGMGLGLYYVKHMVELHQGEVSMRSSKGNGTSLIIKLPLKSE